MSPNEARAKLSVMEKALLDILDILDEALRKIGTIEAHPSTTKDGTTVFTEGGKVYQINREGIEEA